MSERKINYQLVKEVEKYPALYNYTLTEFARKDLKERIWSEIGRTLDTPGSECHVRWENVRTVFARHMKPILNGTTPKAKKPYYLADAMQFVLPYMKNLHPKCLNGSFPQDGQEEEEVVEIKPEYFEEEEEVSSQPPSSPQSTTYAPLPSPAPSISNTTDKQELNPAKRLREGPTDEMGVECLKRENAQIQPDREAMHEANKLFLLSLWPDLNNMSPIQLRKFKRGVIDLIDDVMEIRY